MVAMMSTGSSAQDTKALREVWEDLHLESCPHHYNFHMHTTYSDGKLTPTALIEQAVVIGIKGMAITDHHSIRGYQMARTWLETTCPQPSVSGLPHLWTGVEITASLLDTEVHILGYSFDPEHPLMRPYLQGKQPSRKEACVGNAIAAIHQAGGLAVLAHPVRYHRSASDLIPAAAELGIDGVEAFYAYGNPKPWQASPKETQQVSALSEIYGLYKTCGTDSHGTSLLQRI